MSVSPLPHRFPSAVTRVRGGSLLAGLFLLAAGGCTSLTNPINGVPADRVPPQLFAAPKNNLVPVDISLLALEPPRDYQLGPGDILGIYIEGVLPFNPPNQPPEPPPVNFPEEESTLPPSLGYPIAVQDDGTLSLPLIEPMDVEGLTLDQLRDRIRNAYIEANVLQPERARPIVTLIRERTYNVIVVRQDGGTLQRQDVASQFIRGSERTGEGFIVRLPAYQNDILHALVETGGLPGLNAKNEVKILRASQANRRAREEFLREFNAQQRLASLDPCACPPPLPEDPSILRIPLRLPPGVMPNITEEDVRLEEGDVVYIESRETEVFYTGGLLPGGEFPLPRDYDLDVLGAMAIAGTGAASSRTTGTGLGSVPVTPVPPGLVYILRRTPCNGQVAIEVDLTEAINDPRQRPLIQAGDIIILQYKCEEELINFGMATFFTYGIRELFRR